MCAVGSDTRHGILKYIQSYINIRSLLICRHETRIASRHRGLPWLTDLSTV